MPEDTKIALPNLSELGRHPGVDRRLAAGLSLEQAVEIERQQQDWDAHPDNPDNAGKKKSKKDDGK